MCVPTPAFIDKMSQHTVSLPAKNPKPHHHYQQTTCVPSPSPASPAAAPHASRPTRAWSHNNPTRRPTTNTPRHAAPLLSSLASLTIPSRHTVPSSSPALPGLPSPVRRLTGCHVRGGKAKKRREARGMLAVGYCLVEGVVVMQGRLRQKIGG
ncbi:uncharacterized protein BKA78DRAFT_325575 [Phyllosticta capitalensis]|uniref:uncharacterized protein n=1 Tax=Phyllosticta capitalensis TaxID=121624 RepID=UPI00312F5608